MCFVQMPDLFDTLSEFPIIQIGCKTLTVKLGGWVSLYTYAQILCDNFL